ncbi:GTP cyclohydrolase II [Niallia sp. NCCP-28]|uniref:GTP cyclohydrolase II n=1 Tax=Niallia sp. NCCP-28 TaxID=2934712 RepID=UPI002085E0C7|nr:GTP cyclohydrolase II [Niallia sp. NCCP-28]GKU85192.1 GTP cyclohydrolase II [Niallia sp. NCCP-28]
MEKEVINLLQNKMEILLFNDTNNLCLVGPVNLPVQLGKDTVTFQWYTWLPIKKNQSKEELLEMLPSLHLAEYQQSSVLVYGDFKNAEDALIRMHSICHTGDIFGSKRCDCGFQLRESMKMIVENGSGALFYIANHEGRGIGLFTKSLAYLLQQEGFDTVEANNALDFPDDMRNYEEPIKVLQFLRQKQVKLITNNPKKLAALKSIGLTAEENVPIWGDISEYNENYLKTKVLKSGHIPANEKMVTT